MINESIPEEDRIYSPGKKYWCRKTTKESANKLFEILGIDIVKDGKNYKFIKIEKKPKPQSRPSVSMTPPEEPKIRGVKPGTRRGPYKTKKKVIKDKEIITAICKGCDIKFTYKRTGKRKKTYHSKACKQKHYRQKKKQAELKAEIKRKKKDLL